jgi:hypothetical protein
MLKLLVEKIDFSDIEILQESTDKPMRVKAPMVSFNKRNANKRIYLKEKCLPAVNKFIQEYVNVNAALCQLNHPINQLQTDPALAAGLIESMEDNGEYMVGVTRVLKDLPQGRIVYGLLKEGVRLGMSTRASGTVDGNGIVNENGFNMYAVDFVHNPSGVGCYIDSIMENKEFIIQDNKIVEMAMERLDKNLSKFGSKQIIYSFNSFFQDLKKNYIK